MCCLRGEPLLVAALDDACNAEEMDATFTVALVAPQVPCEEQMRALT
jgi:hypothetical protein